MGVDSRDVDWKNKTSGMGGLLKSSGISGYRANCNSMLSIKKRYC